MSETTTQQVQAQARQLVDDCRIAVEILQADTRAMRHGAGLPSSKGQTPAEQDKALRQHKAKQALLRLSLRSAIADLVAAESALRVALARPEATNCNGDHVQTSVEPRTFEQNRRDEILGPDGDVQEPGFFVYAAWDGVWNDDPVCGPFRTRAEAEQTAADLEA